MLTGTHSNSKQIISEPRRYQIDLKDKALQQNTIAFLGTGSGKTFICVLLIKDMVADLMLREKVKPKLDMSAGPTLSLDSVFAKKTSKTFFVLVDRVPLVFQQADVIEIHTDLCVGRFCGEMGVDFWDLNRWRRQIGTYDVIVMTAQIMLNCLRHGFISLKDIGLMVFDECHHALGDHPYNIIMSEFYFAPWVKMEERPRIFGMTASPVKVGLKRTDGAIYTSAIARLERNLDSKVAQLPEKLQAEIERYIPRPKEFYVKFDPPPTIGKETLWVGECIAHFPAAVMSDCELARYELGEASGIAYLIRRLDDLLKAAETHSKIEIDGLHHSKPPVGQETADLLQREGEGPSPHATWLKANVHGKAGGTNAPPEAVIAFRERLLAFRSSIDRSELVSQKMTKLEALLIETSRDCAEKAKADTLSLPDTDTVAMNGFRALVFVNRRFLAKCVYLALQESAGLKELGINVGLIVGHGTQSGVKHENLSDEVVMGFKEQNDALVHFRAGLTNVLVCTSVVEEGLDVPECELVVMFDGVASMTSYVQSRGRARHLTSKYVVFVQAGSDDETQLRIAHVGERLMESTVNVLRERERGGEDEDAVRQEEVEMEEEDDEEEEEEEGEPNQNWGNVFRIVSTGAIATHLSALDTLGTYCLHLPHDIFYSTKPEFSLETSEGESEKRFRVRVKLPSTAAIQESIGDWTKTKRRAKQSAALHAVVDLYEANALNDYLMPNISAKNNSKYRSRLKKPGVYVQEPFQWKDEDDQSASPFFQLCHGVARILREPPVFSVFSGQDTSTPTSTMHLYCLQMEKELPLEAADRAASSSEAEWGSIGVVMPLVPIGIILRERLHHLPPPFMHYSRPHGRLRTTLDYIGEVSLTDGEYGAAHRFQSYWNDIATCSYNCERKKENKRKKDEEEQKEKEKEGMGDIDSLIEGFGEIEIEEEEVIDIDEGEGEKDDGMMGPILSEKPPLPMVVNRDGVIPAIGDMEKEKEKEENSFWKVESKDNETITYQKRYGRKIIRRRKRVKKVAIPKSYLVVPLSRENLLSMSAATESSIHSVVDWDTMNAVSKFESERASSDGVSDYVPIDGSMLAKWNAQEEESKMKDEDEDEDDKHIDEFMVSTGHCVRSLPSQLRSAVVISEDMRKKYRLLRIRWDITPNISSSGIDLDLDMDHIESDVDGLTDHPTLIKQPMLEVTPMPRHAPDLHLPTSVKGGLGFNYDLDIQLGADPDPDLDIEIGESILPRRLLLVPSLSSLLYVPATVGLQESALCLPSVMIDFERWALTEELEASVGTEIGDMMLIQALTSAASHSTLNYEALETFGDSILKYLLSFHVFLHHPNKHQGNLTVLKETIVTNQSLVRAVLRRNLAPFLSVLPHRASDWDPSVCMTHKVTVKSKTLADTLEALLGAVFFSKDQAYQEESGVGGSKPLNFREPMKYNRRSKKTISNASTYVDGQGNTARIMDLCRRQGEGEGEAPRSTKRFKTSDGNATVLKEAIDGVNHFLNWAGILPPEPDRMTVEDYIKMYVPQPPYSTRLRKMWMLLEPVQKIIGYTFRNPPLLVEAFTHGSVLDAPTQCYQRLEFLGDAALDFFITRYLWFEYPDIKPIDASDMRQNLCTNEHFARVVVETGLHRFILHHAPPLMGAITDALHQQENLRLREKAGKPVDLFEITAPKVLGDVLESLAGAVLLDAGPDVFFEVFWKLLEPYMIPADHIVLAPLRRVSIRAKILNKINRQLDRGGYGGGGERGREGKKEKEMEKEKEKYQSIRYETLEHEQTTNNKNRVVVGIYFQDRLLATGEARNTRLARRKAAMNASMLEDWGVESKVPSYILREHGMFGSDNKKKPNRNLKSPSDRN